MSTQQEWIITRSEFNPQKIHHDETVFTIGNGYLSTRGSFEESFPEENAATFIHGVFDDIPVVFTELVNVPNWLDCVLILDGERFRLDYGEILDYENQLDLSKATLTRSVKWRSPAGKAYQISFERVICLHEQHLLLLRVGINPLDGDAEVIFRSGINGCVSNEGYVHWKHKAQSVQPGRGWLSLVTKKSETGLGMSFSLKSSLPQIKMQAWNMDMHPVLNCSGFIPSQEVLWFEKRVTVYTTRDVQEPIHASETLLGQLKASSWEDLISAHQKKWQQVWTQSDIEIDSEDDAQIAIRYNLFQLLIAAPWQDEQVNIGAKTLSGYGYHGHVFWDTEIFMLPFFTYTQPQVARNLLSYRYHRLAGARKKAKENGYLGAQFPWESADDGEEVTPTWVQHPTDRTKLTRIWTGDIQIHVSADIALAVWRYGQVSGDDKFLHERGIPIILETALFWESRAEWNEINQTYQFSDVIGPDEYHDHVDNNAYNNFMVRWHFRIAEQAAHLLQAHEPDLYAGLVDQLGLSDSRMQHWLEIANHIYFEQDALTGLIEQFQGFFQLEDLDWKSLEPRSESIQSLLGIEATNQVQALKQADVLMLFYLFPDAFPSQIMAVNYDYYNARTDHTYGSSLGPSIHALVACQLGKTEEAYQHFIRSAHADLYDVRGNAGDGIHAASAGGLWQAVVFGFGGLRVDEYGYHCQSRLPKKWRRLRFRFCYRGEWITIQIPGQEVRE
ncbi:MAG: glycoside hydrolase family 65 protein [Chloroflexi bacterium HGW-Chloroflexi-10]|nr:MAG: glycoside hydrolase family 65 protein [Chloroflexi bacterium HGW-Chloroflexi-10]